MTAGTDPRQTGASPLTRSTWATRAQFLALGLVAGVWGAHIPSVKQTYGLTEGSLSMMLLAISLGAVFALLVAGRTVHRWGTRRTAQATAGAFGLSLALSLWWPSGVVALVAMVFFGAAMSLFDVAINTEGSALEAAGQRHVMGNLHGNFSLGGMLGALLAGGLIKSGVPAPWQMLGVGCAVSALAMASARGMQRVVPASAPQVHTDTPHAQARRTPLLWWLGLLCFAGMSAEGALYDWGVLYLNQEVGMPQAHAAWGYAAFAGAMAIGRFTGDTLRNRYPETRLLRLGGFTTAAAMATVLLVEDAWVALPGFAVMGLSLSMVVPMLYNAASRVPGVDRARGIATVSAIGYLGFLLGPPVIGQVAEWTRLAWALSLVIPMALVLGWGARWMPQAVPPQRVLPPAQA